MIGVYTETIGMRGLHRVKRLSFAALGIAVLVIAAWLLPPGFGTWFPTETGKFPAIRGLPFSSVAARGGYCEGFTPRLQILFGEMYPQWRQPLADGTTSGCVYLQDVSPVIDVRAYPHLDGGITLRSNNFANIATINDHSAPVLAIDGGYRDSQYLFLSADRSGNVQLHRLNENGRGAARRAALELLSRQNHGAAVWAAAISPDGRTFATAGADGNVKVWPVSHKGDASVLPAANQTVFALAFNYNGKKLAAAGSDGMVRLWDLIGHTGVTIRDHEGPVFALAFSRDVLATGGEDGTVRFWTADGKQYVQPLRIFSGPVLAISPLLVLAGEEVPFYAGGWDGNAAIIHPHGTLTRLPRATKVDLIAAVSPSGRFAASSEVDVLRVWDVRPPSLRLTVTALGPLISFATLTEDVLTVGYRDGSKRGFKLDSGAPSPPVEPLPSVGRYRINRDSISKSVVFRDQLTRYVAKLPNILDGQMLPRRSPLDWLWGRFNVLPLTWEATTTSSLQPSNPRSPSRLPK